MTATTAASFTCRRCKRELASYDHAEDHAYLTGHHWFRVANFGRSRLVDLSKETCLRQPNPDR